MQSVYHCRRVLRGLHCVRSELTVKRPPSWMSVCTATRALSSPPLRAFLYESAFNSANFLTALMLQQVFLFAPFHAGIILGPELWLWGSLGLGQGSWLTS